MCKIKETKEQGFENTYNLKQFYEAVKDKDMFEFGIEDEIEAIVISAFEKFYEIKDSASESDERDL